MKKFQKAMIGQMMMHHFHFSPQVSPPICPKESEKTNHSLQSHKQFLCCLCCTKFKISTMLFFSSFFHWGLSKVLEKEELQADSDWLIRVIVTFRLCLFLFLLLWHWEFWTVPSGSLLAKDHAIPLSLETHLVTATRKRSNLTRDPTASPEQFSRPIQNQIFLTK